MVENTKEMREKLEEAQKVFMFNKVIQMCWDRGDMKGSFRSNWYDKKRVKDIAVDRKREVVAFLLERQKWEYISPYGGGAGYWVEVGVLRGGKIYSSGEIKVRDQVSPAYDDFSKWYNKVRIIEITDEKVVIEAKAEREEGRTDRFEFEV